MRRGGGCGEEAFQVFVDDPVQDRVGGGARDIGSHGAGPSRFRAVAPAVPLDGRTAYTREPSRRAQQPSQPSVARTRHRNRSP
jgi:hypothetical protein